MTDVAGSKYLSARAREIISKPPLGYFNHILKCWEDPYSASNPDGYFCLGLAENKCHDAELVEKLNSIRRGPKLGYQMMTGVEDTKQAVARGFGRWVAPGVKISTDHVVLMNGVGSLVHALALSLGTPGDTFMFPRPRYPAFPMDTSTVAQVGELVCDAVTTAALEAAYKPGCKALVLTNPGNPAGDLVSEGEIREAYAFCQKHNMMLILDEIYGATVSPKYRSEFKSGLTLWPELPEDVVVLWGMSKDFCMSGIRCGVLIATNPALLQALGTFAIFHGISVTTQQDLAAMLSDTAWADDFLRRNAENRDDMLQVVTDTLTELQIPFVQPKAAIFIWMDFRQLLEEPTEAGEEKFLCDLMEPPTRMFFTPGRDFRPVDDAFGFFRMCYLYFDKPGLEEAMRRFKVFVNERRARLSKAKM
mmetsp:Transcript_36138/g.88491  ORF Transcript_36138/g.88491 Transcript_36138/m.88491 type:complete len:419 (+) Transcript_36138:57-1313(+)